MALVPFDPIPVPRAHVWLNGGGGTLADADWFFSEWISFFTSAGPAGGYFATPTDVAKWIKAFMSGQLHSPDIMAQAKTVVTATGLPGGTKYGLGLMERTLLGQKGYGHGGDIGYSSFSLYFPGKDVSIAVLNNDQTKTSWTLVPVIQALLKVCIDYEMSVPTTNPYENTDFEVLVSPNPFSENLKVSFNLPTAVAESQLVLSNSLGQTVHQKTVQNLNEGKQNLSMDQLDALPQGVYFLSLVLDGTLCKTFRVVK
jgi:CubicO group peptidase (beta-lactamase class C family)